jgi:hypothetical protein
MSDEMKLCSGCKTPMSADDKFCPTCGADAGLSAAAFAKEEGQPSSPKASPNQGESAVSAEGSAAPQEDRSPRTDDGASRISHPESCISHPASRIPDIPSTVASEAEAGDLLVQYNAALVFIEGMSRPFEFRVKPLCSGLSDLVIHVNNTPCKVSGRKIAGQALRSGAEFPVAVDLNIPSGCSGLLTFELLVTCRKDGNFQWFTASRTCDVHPSINDPQQFNTNVHVETQHASEVHMSGLGDLAKIKDRETKFRELMKQPPRWEVLDLVQGHSERRVWKKGATVICLCCGAESKAGDDYCTGCGEALEWRCGECSTEEIVDVRFCSCGTDVKGFETAQEILEHVENLTREKRWLLAAQEYGRFDRSTKMPGKKGTALRKRLEELNRTVAEKVNRLNDLFQTLEIQLSADNLDGALTVAKQIKEIEPSNEKALELIAELPGLIREANLRELFQTLETQSASGDYNGALAAAKAITELDPQNEKAQEKISELSSRIKEVSLAALFQTLDKQLSAGEFRSAQATAKAVTQIDPTNAKAQEIIRALPARIREAELNTLFQTLEEQLTDGEVRGAKSTAEAIKQIDPYNAKAQQLSEDIPRFIELQDRVKKITQQPSLQNDPEWMKIKTETLLREFHPEFEAGKPLFMNAHAVIVAMRDTAQKELARRAARTMKLRLSIAAGIGAVVLLWIGTDKVMTATRRHAFNEAVAHKETAQAKVLARKLGSRYATADDLAALRRYTEAKQKFESGPGDSEALLQKIGGADWVAVQELVKKAEAPGDPREGERFYLEALALGAKVQVRYAAFMEQYKRFDEEMSRQDAQKLACYAPSDWQKLQSLLAVAGAAPSPESGAAGFQRALEQLKRTVERCNSRLAVKQDVDKASAQFREAWSAVDQTTAVHYMPVETSEVEKQMQRADELAGDPDQYEDAAILYRTAAEAARRITERSERMLAARRMYEKLLEENKSDAEWMMKTASGPWQLSRQLAEQAAGASTPEKAYDFYRQAVQQIQLAADAADAARRRAKGI